MNWQHLKDLLKGEVPLSKIRNYIVGNFRYKIYYSKMFGWLMRNHIREQIDFRIKFMNKECYNNGSCKICGCSTTALQMCNSSCEEPCYPRMMSRTEWRNWKRYLFFEENEVVWFIDEKDPDKQLRKVPVKYFK